MHALGDAVTRVQNAELQQEAAFIRLKAAQTLSLIHICQKTGTLTLTLNADRSKTAKITITQNQKG